MVGWSVDLRERVVAAVEGGMTQQRAAEVFSVSLPSVERWLARWRGSGTMAPAVQRHGPWPVKKHALHAWLPGRLALAADATLAEHQGAVAAELGLVVSTATISRAIASLPPPADPPGAGLTPTGRQRRPGRPLKQRP